MQRNPLGLILVLLAITGASPAWGNPFCCFNAYTEGRRIRDSEVAIVAEQLSPPRQRNEAGEVVENVPARFKVVEILKGDAVPEIGSEIQAAYYRTTPTGTHVLITNSRLTSDPNRWFATAALNEPRLRYFQALAAVAPGLPHWKVLYEHLEHPDEVVSAEAFVDLEMCEYWQWQRLQPYLNRRQLLAWVDDSAIPPRRRELYLNLLGICGTERDIATLEAMMLAISKSPPAMDLDARAERELLGPVIANYLLLKGSEGLPEIERRFLTNPNASWLDVGCAARALRSHISPIHVIPRNRLLKSMKLLLDRPSVAYFVIEDLARAGDWSVRRHLVEMFREADGDDASWLRTSILMYLDACPLPEAKADFETLGKLDPQALSDACLFRPQPSQSSTADMVP